MFSTAADAPGGITPASDNRKLSPGPKAVPLPPVPSRVSSTRTGAMALKRAPAPDGVTPAEKFDCVETPAKFTAFTLNWYATPLVSAGKFTVGSVVLTVRPSDAVTV